MINYIKFIDVNDEEHSFTVPEEIINDVRFEVSCDVDATISYILTHIVYEDDANPNFVLSIVRQIKDYDCKEIKVDVDGVELSYDITDFKRLYNLTPYYERAREKLGAVMVENLRIISEWSE